MLKNTHIYHPKTIIFTRSLSIVLISLTLILSFEFLTKNPFTKILTSYSIGHYLIQIAFLCFSVYIFIQLLDIIQGKRHKTYYLNFRFLPLLPTSTLIFTIFEFVLHHAEIHKILTAGLFQYEIIVFISILLILLCTTIYAFTAGPDRISPEHTNVFDITNINTWDKKTWDSFIDSMYPIVHPDQDILSVTEKAKQISGILLKDNPESIAITGSYGTGKSSLINLVSYSISNDKNTSPKILQIWINGWGTSKGHIAEYTLSQIIEELSKHIDCSSIKDLPKEYVNAISSSHKALSLISFVLTSNKDPLDTLHELDDILRVTNIKVILYLEDIDRNRQSSQVEEELPALLDKFNELHNVSFILAIGEGESYFDIITRVCINKYTLSDLIPTKISYTILQQFLQYLEDPEYIIEDEIHEEEFGFKTYVHNGTSEIQANYINYLPAVALSKLNINIRQLKHVLRNTSNKWKKLKGEISKFDLICLCTLEQSYPKALKFITDNINQLKHYGFESLYYLNNKSEFEILNTHLTLEGNDNISAKQKAASRLLFDFCKYYDNIIPDSNNVINDTISKITDETRNLSVIIKFLFSTNNDRKQPIANIGNNIGVDYFQRFITLNFVETVECRDQAIMNNINDFVTNGKNVEVLSTMICKSIQYTRQYETFKSKRLTLYQQNELILSILKQSLNYPDISENTSPFNGNFWDFISRQIDEQEKLFSEQFDEERKESTKSDLDYQYLVLERTLSWLKNHSAVIFNCNIDVFSHILKLYFFKYKILNSHEYNSKLYQKLILDLFDHKYNSNYESFIYLLSETNHFSLYWSFIIHDLLYKEISVDKSTIANLRKTLLNIFEAIVLEDNEAHLLQTTPFFENDLSKCAATHIFDNSEKTISILTKLHKKLSLINCTNDYHQFDTRQSTSESHGNDYFEKAITNLHYFIYE